jgi:endonuclease YncB( thermonuclease family)
MNFIKRLPILLLLPFFSIFAQIPNIIVPNEKAFYIVDGDSLSLQMRIYGIDTPEKGQKCQKTKTEFVDCGLKAKESLKYFFKNSKGKITIEPVTFGYYGRMLVKVFRNDQDIGALMVRSGIAFSYGSHYKTEERLAKKEKLGFWGYYKKPQKPSIWRKSHKWHK